MEPPAGHQCDLPDAAVCWTEPSSGFTLFKGTDGGVVMRTERSHDLARPIMTRSSLDTAVDAGLRSAVCDVLFSSVMDRHAAAEFKVLLNQFGGSLPISPCKEAAFWTGRWVDA